MESSLHNLISRLDAYRRPSAPRAIWELSITAGALLAFWGAAFLVFHLGFWWAALLLTVPAALFLVRLFMIQHDCGHQAFFSAKAANDWVGRIIGVLTLTPYDYWRRTHAMHHSTSANLDRRGGLGDIRTLTVDEYMALPPIRRLGYRLYRHPLVLFGLGPFFTFFLMQRLPFGLFKDGWRPWASTMGTTAAAVAGLALLAWLLGPVPALLVTGLTMLIGATIGVWLFFVQHQFEGVEWLRQKNWKRDQAALLGSSHYDLPQPLRWLTANIGIHHVHHLSARIPFYRLPQVLKDLPELKDVSRLGLVESFRCASLALWDEAGGRLISFRAARRMRLAADTV
ncbi:fatty acid desaturase [Caulobacter sp. KR2-114]|uniref:fatty acid desaturase n=1 Tax=Caulobacter sp. KR2-114 TaxID=3400912 RepID=UPI003C2EBA65